MPKLQPSIEADRHELFPEPLGSASVNYRAIVKHKLSKEKAINLRRFEHKLKKVEKS